MGVVGIALRPHWRRLKSFPTQVIGIRPRPHPVVLSRSYEATVGLCLPSNTKPFGGLDQRDNGSQVGGGPFSNARTNRPSDLEMTYDNNISS